MEVVWHENDFLKGIQYKPSCCREKAVMLPFTYMELQKMELLMKKEELGVKERKGEEIFFAISFVSVV